MTAPDTPAGSGTAVAVGSVIGVGVAYTAQFFASLVFLWALVAQGVPRADLSLRVYESDLIFVLLLLANLLGGLIGGYWSARLSAGHQRSAVLAGVVAAFFTAVQYYLLPYQLPTPTWARISSILLPVLAYSLGGWLLSRRTQ